MFDPSTVAAIALKTSLLVVVGGFVASLMGRRSAAWRHLLWAAALALSLLMPIAAAILPSWAQVSVPWENAVSWPGEETATVAVDARHDVAEPAAPGPRQERRSSAAGETRVTWPSVMLVWLVGACLLLLRNAFAHVGLIRWVRESRPRLSPAWAATLRRTAGEAGFLRRLRVLESAHTTGPCTFGFLRPVVLLPAAGAGWSEAERRFTLLHELAHVRRFDYLTAQIASIACAIHWYNPLVWFAAGRARRLQEEACDDAVLNAGGTPSDYAQFLVELAGGSRRPSPAFPAAVGMVRRAQLRGRVTSILDASRTRLPLGGVVLLSALAPLGALMLLLATLSIAGTGSAMQSGNPLTATFGSVELRNGGHVSLVHGPSQSVTLAKGDPEQASIGIRDDGRLVIDRCPTDCPHNRDFEVVVVTPVIGALTVAEGGTMQARGEFPPQPEIGVAVSQGGAIDIRRVPAASVTATVFNGGLIFARPGTALSADIEQGGNITYWGDAVVESSVRHGGVVVHGAAADEDKSLAELVGAEIIEPVPAVPPVPPVAPIPATHH